MSAPELKKALSHRWLLDVPRVVPRPNDPKETRALIHRSSLLGNAVVPQAVALAYQSLATVLRDSVLVPRSAARDGSRKSPPLSKNIVLVEADPGRRKMQLSGRHAPHFGAPDAAERISILPRPHLAYQPPPSAPLTLEMRNSAGNQPMRKVKHWQTPRHHTSTWGQCRILNERAMWNLANNIYYEVGTRAQCPQAKNVNRMSDVCIINPQFVENMMGYPLDWTKTEVGRLPKQCSETHVKHRAYQCSELELGQSRM